MADCTAVVSAYTDLRDALSNLAMRATDPVSRNILLQRAVVSGSLAEQCDAKYAGRDVPGGGNAIDKANAATALANGATGHDPAQNRQVIAAADRANDALAALVAANGFTSGVSGALFGSLRITPSRSSLARSGGNFAAAAAEKPKATTPGYVSDVAKLFPVEAAALFPLGQSIAGNNPVVLLIVILATGGFVVALRYFATQEDGKASWNEIGGALVSLLLWIGATKGYWVTGKGLFDPGISAASGGALFGFLTVMWVALAPYLVKEKARRDAAADSSAAP